MDTEPTPTEPTPVPARGAVSSKVVGALIGAIAALSIGGVGLAFAQDAPTTTTPPTTTDAPHVRGDCPDKDGGATTGGSTADDNADPATTADGAGEV
jgi:hypothetical protein